MGTALHHLTRQKGKGTPCCFSSSRSTYLQDSHSFSYPPTQPPLTSLSSPGSI